MAAPSGSDSSQDIRLDLASFLDTWTDQLPESYFLTNIDKNVERSIVKREMEVSDEMIEELENVCSVETLKMDDNVDESIPKEDLENDPLLAECLMLHVIPEHALHNLITLRTHKDHLLAQAAFPEIKKQYLPYVSEFKQKKMDPPKKQPPSPGSDEITIEMANEDLLITIQVFQPMLYHKGKCSAFVDCEYNVRGSTRLSAFRDVIQCVRDSVIAADLSADPDPQKYPKARDVYKSGFLYIDQVFYNDMRDPSAIDYSENILAWGRREKMRELMESKAVEMGDRKFIDLKLKLNEVYLYQHQGDCQHVFAFTDIRVAHEDDPPDVGRTYPMLTKNKHKKRQLCRMCWKLQARWLVTEDPYAVDDPTYMCDTCLRCLHYDDDGQKTKESGDFHAFYFQDRSHMEQSNLVSKSGDG